MNAQADDTETLALTGSESVPDRRPCTRCDGEQVLSGSGRGMGAYRCANCELGVGFDIEARPPEFLLSRGLPRRYTKDVFGDRLLPAEQRLEPVS